jgi:uncharacterized protein YqeY
MSLFKDIETQLIQAMRDKNAERLSVLRMLKSSVKNAAIEKGGADYAPTDPEVVAVVRKEIKKRQDSVESFQSAGRGEMAEKEKREIIVLESYLPAGLSEAELEKLVKEAIAEVGATGKAQMGAVMKAAQARAAGRADGKALSALVQKLLPA